MDEKSGKKKIGLRCAFLSFSQYTARCTGNPYAFLLATIAVLLWAGLGPVYKYSDTWQLVINTGSSIVTFLMVFLIQSTQNREGRALQLKLAELIRATDGAHTVLLDLENLNEQELETISKKYYDIAEVARSRLRRGKSDTDIPNVVMDGPLSLGNSP